MTTKKNGEAGVSYIEASIILVIAVPLMLYIMDLARVAYIQTTIRTGLTESIKRFESDKRLVYNVWNKQSIDPGLNDFQAARESVINYALSRMSGRIFTGVVFKEVSHYDDTSDGASLVYEAPLAYMPPGYSGVVNEVNLPVMNPSKCSQEHTQACEHSKAVNYNDNNQTLTKLSNIYPTTLTAYAQVKTLFMGTKLLKIQVAGFPSSSVPYTANEDIPDNHSGATCQAANQDTVKTFCWNYDNGDNHVSRWLYQLAFGYWPETIEMRNAGIINDPLLLQSIISNSWGWIDNSVKVLNFGQDSVCFQTLNRDRAIEWASGDPLELSCNKEACGFQYCDRIGVGCFDPSTKILMSGGEYKEIKDIQLSESVLNPVTGNIMRIKHLIKGPERIPMYEFKVGDKSIKVTETHPMYTHRGLLKAKDVTQDDLLILDDQKSYPITLISLLPVKAGQEVYNIEIDTDSLDASDRMLSADGIVTGDYAIQKNIS